MDQATALTQWTDCRAIIILPRRRRDITVNEMDGEALLLDPLTGSLHRFNQTAYAVWQLCDGRASTRRMADQLTQVYDLSAEDALDHVEQVVTLFAKLGLFELSADGASDEASTDQPGGAPTG